MAWLLGRHPRGFRRGDYGCGQAPLVALGSIHIQLKSMLKLVAGTLTLGVLAIAFNGCKSAQLKSQNISVFEDQWTKTYKDAKSFQASGDSANACLLYKSLAQMEHFPARELAELRQFQTCSSIQIPQLTRERLPPYLRNLAIDIYLEQVQKLSDRKQELYFVIEKSKQKLAQKEKVFWINRALDLARELDHKDVLPELQSRLYRVAPRMNPNPSPEDWLDIAADYRLNRDFQKAREYYERVIASPDFSTQDKISAFKGLRLANKNSRDKSAYLLASQRLISYLDSALKKAPRSKSLRKAYYDASIFYGRALWTEGKSTAAKKIFSRLERQFKGKLSLTELYWLKGRMQEEESNFDEVSRFMQAAQREPMLSNELQEKVAWYSGWNERRRKNFDLAIKNFTELSESTQSEFTRMRALFWLGKTLAEASNEEAKSKAVFQRLIDLDPLGYYGLLARRQLGIPISLSRSESPSPIKVDLPLNTQLASWLAQVDEHEALTALLDLGASIYKRMPEQNDEGWVSIFKLYAQGGLYMRLYESLVELPAERRRILLESNPDLLFPQPWNEAVRLASLQSGVGEELIYAIMRQESAFNPRARSSADAFGLMQLLPEVAERLDREGKTGYRQADDLYEPKINIALGAAHLQELLNRHKNKFILAVAAYNADERVIQKWMQHRYRGDALEFIEEIPYEETRAYVRLVMRNLIFYSLLRSQSASIEFPSWILNLGPS